MLHLIKFKIIYISLLLLLVANPLAAKKNLVAVDNITYYTENYPPANYLENGELKGISIDTLKALWKHLNKSEPNILVVPWARGYRFALEQANTALFTMSRTPSREHQFKWVGPLFNSTHVLIAKKSKKFNFSNIDEIFDYDIVTIRGDITETSLEQLGFPSQNIAKVTEPKQGFLMMQSDRVDMIALSINGFYHLTEELDLNQSEYEQVWTINKIGNYIAFNNEVSVSFIKTFQQAFNDIKAERIKIKQRYGLPIEEY